MNARTQVVLPAVIAVWVTCGGLPGLGVAIARAGVSNDPANHLLTISDDSGQLSLKLDYDTKSLVKEASVRGRQVLSIYGACSAIKTTDGNWYTTRDGIVSPTVTVNGNVATVSGIDFGGSGVTVAETWTFTAKPNSITWKIDRNYPAAGTLMDTYFPGWDFASGTTWTGGLLDNGGVAWMSLLNSPLRSLGSHAGAVTFWDKTSNSSLKIVPTVGAGVSLANRFTKQPNGAMTYCSEVTSASLTTKHNLSTYLAAGDDVWNSFAVSSGTISASYELSALDYAASDDIGTLNGIDGAAVREMSNTIARYGVLDNHHAGLNGWATGYICLHEPYLGKVAAAVNQPDYTQAVLDSYAFYRSKAVQPSGRVLARYKDTTGDEQPGTYTADGFYEAQWGTLLDSQPDYVIVVSDLFNLTGDRSWVTAQKPTCESVLDYLLARDSDGDGLVEMMNSTHLDGKSSDWIDVVWAAYENALVNAELYGALRQWADIEDVLGDSAKATSYRSRAQKLKQSYNKPTDQGGFWDGTNSQYIYWRDADDSLHGTNLVTPVQFAAIGYGVCDDPARVTAILSKVEAGTAAEGLFTWPLSMTAYAAGEQGSGAFPNYENGDLFLSWNELALRSYVKFAPNLAVKYVKNVISKYNSDGLAHQRYLRHDQTGAGDDILAGNYLTIAGLYSSVYGVQPFYNRLYLEPHLTPELNGTALKYQLRGQSYLIGLQSQGDYSLGVGGLTIADNKPFAADLNTPDEARYFAGADKTSRLQITRSNGAALKVDMSNWSPTSQQWTETASSATTTTHDVAQLTANATYAVYVNGTELRTLTADGSGTASFVVDLGASAAAEIRLGEPGAEGGAGSGGAAGGNAGSTQTAGAGGNGANAGNAAATGGSGGNGASTPAPASGTHSGCSCSAAGSPAGQPLARVLFSLLAMMSWGLRRRRRSSMPLRH